MEETAAKKLINDVMEKIGGNLVKPGPYEEFIAKTRYAKWLESENRREDWPETVQRYILFMLTDVLPKIEDPEKREEAANVIVNECMPAILNFEVMPSMRALMTAGEALRRDHTASYNPVAGYTRVITKEFGTIEIQELSGKSATVLNVKGEWADATFRSYGVQPTKSVVLTISRSGVEKCRVIHCTDNHRWVLADGTVMSTDQLRPGMEIPYVPEEGIVAAYHWKVENIIDNEFPTEVFCAEVPNTNTFVLEGGIVTGNCSYIAVNSKRAFSEALKIFLAGTGLGFSVERQEISQLPLVPEVLRDTEDVIVVADSKEGWAKSFAKLISCLYQGDVPKIDYSKVRPAGARLKTFGGRASGPGPLKEMFEFVIRTFRKAAGRKLNSLECHDIMCMIANIVVVAGIRRAASISLSNLSDQRMRDAKSGQWWVDHPYRALANNSVMYTEKPSPEVFLEEWLALIKSKSGERGIVNRIALQNQAARYGKRKKDEALGPNPCTFGDTLLLTNCGLRPVKLLAEYQENPIILASDGKWSPSRVIPTGVKPGKKVTLSNGLSFKLTDDHKVMVMRKKYKSQNQYPIPTPTEVKDLVIGDKMRPFVAGVEWSGEEVFKESRWAILAGYLQGDGSQCDNRIATINNEPEVREFINELFPEMKWNKDGSARFPKGVREELERAGLSFVPLPERDLPEHIFNWSSTTTKLFLKGLFSANGCLHKKVKRISLKTTSKALAEKVQLLLLALGYNAYITVNKPKAIKWRNGTYTSKQSYDVNIQGPRQVTKFQEEIGFLHKHKMEPVEGDMTYKTPKPATIVSIEQLDPEPVYDFVEPATNFAWVNGLTISNCSEIILRDREMCNLSEVIVRSDDDAESLKEKVRIATILGTLQATLTKFTFLSEKWKQNCEEEALIGVSMTGIMDNELTNGRKGKELLIETLSRLREYTGEVNVEWAKMLGINRSGANTAVKPSGCRTKESLITTSEGIFSLEDFEYSDDWKATDLPGMKDYGHITKTFNNGVSPVLELQLSYGMKLRSTSNHKWYVNGKGWTRTDEICSNDRIVFNKNVYDKKTEAEIPQQYEGLDYPETMSPKLAWLIGLLYNDASMYDNGILKIRDRSSHVLIKAKECIEELFHEEVSFSNDGEISCLKIGSSNIIDFLKNNGLLEKQCVPLLVRKSSKESVIAFIAGVLDINIGLTFVCNFYTSFLLEERALRVQETAMACGQILDVRCRNSGNGKVFYSLERVHKLSTDKDIFGQYNHHYEKPHKFGKEFADRDIGVVESIKYIGEHETFDVETEDHWFYAGAFVSHNTVSELCNTSSGIHARHAPYYLRTVRVDKKDPVYAMLKDQGQYMEDEYLSPNSTAVAYFPKKSPDGAIVRNDMTAIEQLEFMMLYQEYWCEHKVSITVTVRDDEWLDVGAWCYRNFDKLAGVSFLPHSDHIYQQAPFQEVSKEDWEKWIKEHPPVNIDWSKLPEYEKEDTTTSSQELACTAGGCELR